HIIGYCEMLMEQAQDDGLDIFLADLNLIHSAGEQLLGVVDDLCDPVAHRKMDEASMHHEVRTPLNQVIGYAEMLQEQAKELGHDSFASDLQKVHTAGRRLLDLIVQNFASIELKSDTVGSDFITSKRQQAFAREPTEEQYKAAGAATVTGSLLVVDDNEPNRDMLTRRLERLGYEVSCAENGSEALKLLRTEAFDLRQIEEEKQRLDELLHVILPRDVAAELKATDAVKPRRFERVGILFCDIVEFTSYSARRGPEEILSHLQALVETFEQLCLKHDLEKIRTIGDSFMATAGLMTRLDNPALNCVRCGLEMVVAARELPARWQVRVGVHVGPVIAGVVGHRKYQYDVWGDAVNTASRVEQAAGAGSVCVNKDTWDLIAERSYGRSLGQFRLKGKGEQELFVVDAV